MRACPRRLLPLALLASLVGSFARSAAPVAGDEPPPPAQPAPPEPPRLVYLDPAGVASAIAALEVEAKARSVPFLRTEFGTSAGGKPLEALWIGDCVRLPVALVHGGLASNDAAGTVAALDFARRLVGPEGDSARSRLGYVVLPAPNPDALEAFLARRPRAGGGGADRDLDGKAGEDGPDDLDQDGEIRSLRRAGPLGTFAAGDEVGREGTPERDPRLLLDRGADAARARSYELLTEGSDDDGDGRVDEDPPGLDLTRALAGFWDHQGGWGGDGRYAGEAPEARALMDLSAGLTNLVAWYGFRSEGPFLMRASEHGAHADHDNGLYDRLAPALERLGGAPLRRVSERAVGRNPGSDLDWASFHLGALAFALPVWRIAKQPGWAVERPVADEVDWLLWNDTALGGKGFKAWTPFTHPTLGSVEIGGWARFTRHEPPPEHLTSAVRAVSAAPLAQAEHVASLRLDLTVTEASPGLFEVRARVLNVGTLPTETPLARQRRVAHPVRLWLEPADGVERVAGPKVADAGVIEAGKASAETRWLLRRDPPRVNRMPEPMLGTLRAAHRAWGAPSAEVSAR
jgi:hypothetical protein